MTIPELATIIASIGTMSGIILYLLQKRLLNQSLSVSITRDVKEVEQLEQEISSKYALQVKKWIDDLEEIQEKHEAKEAKKDLLIHELQGRVNEFLAENALLKLKLSQCGRAHRRLFVELAIPYWECSKDGKLIYANGYWLKLFGLTQEEAMGDGWLKSIPAEEKDKLLVEWYSRVIDEADGVIDFTVTNPITKNTYKVRAIYAVKFDDHGEVYKIIGVTSIISDGV